MDTSNKSMKVVVAVVALVLGLAGGYFYGYKKGDTAGYKRAEADVKSLQEAEGQKATAEAVKAANPFQSANPLEGVEANPFEKAKKVLNPFE